MSMEAFYELYLLWGSGNGDIRDDLAKSRCFANIYEESWKGLIQFRETSQHARFRSVTHIFGEDLPLYDDKTGDSWIPWEIPDETWFLKTAELVEKDPWERFAPGPVQAVSVAPVKKDDDDDKPVKKRGRPPKDPNQPVKKRGRPRKNPPPIQEASGSVECPFVEPSSVAAVAVPPPEPAEPEVVAGGVESSDVQPDLPTRATFAGRTKLGSEEFQKQWESRRLMFYTNVPKEMWKDHVEREFWSMCSTAGDNDVGLKQFLEKKGHTPAATAQAPKAKAKSKVKEQATLDDAQFFEQEDEETQLNEDGESESTVARELFAKHPVDDAKTLSIASGGDDVAMNAVQGEVASEIGTSTALELEATTDEKLAEDSSIGNSGPIPVAAIGYLKGAARVTTAMAFVVACYKMNVLQHEEIDQGFLGRLKSGDPTLEMDLLSIMDILNSMASQQTPGPSVGELEASKSAVDSSALQLVIQEIQYDEKCIAAFNSRMKSYEIRLAHQKNEWVSKRLSDDPPAEHLEAPPEPPALKKCTYGKVDGQIVTLEIPEAILKQWESKPEFKTYYEEFLGRNPPVKEFKGMSKKKTSDPSKTGTPPILPKKRRLVEDISGSIVDVAALADPDQVVIEVPIVNARAAKKLTTMPLLRISMKNGPLIVNQTGQDVPGQEY
eukprot:s2116_g5.t1